MSAHPRSDSAFSTPAPTAKPSKAALWTGWILGSLVAISMISGSVPAFLGLPQMAEGMAKFGYSPSILRPIGLLELVCPILYLIPRTAVFGAILLTAYMGGAVATHARIGDPMWVVPVVVGIVAWVALLLRQPRLRALVLAPSDPQV